MKIIPIYAALLALLFVALSIRTIRTRRKAKVALGDGGNAQLLRAVGVHANFAEYAPLALFLLYLVEESGAPFFFVHGLCSCLLLGRLSHAYGVSQENENFRFRVMGMILTFFILVTSSLYLVGSRLF